MTVARKLEVTSQSKKAASEFMSFGLGFQLLV
jgi:hypothetical protein